MTTIVHSLLPTPNWTNQNIALFHGTVNTQVPSIFNGIKITNGRQATDFGQGFYTTTVERQARTWAWVLSNQRTGTLPAVIRYDVDRDELARLNCLWFVRGNYDADDFWSFVFYCRLGMTPHGRNTTVNSGKYDIVIGPVAASWIQRLTIYDADQVSFHTQNAVDLLNKSPRSIS